MLSAEMAIIVLEQPRLKKLFAEFNIQRTVHRDISL